MTKFIQFKNHKKELLRGLLEEGQGENGVLFLHGFERSSIEPHFKNIVDFMKGVMTTLRFDYSGCGLSDGSFKDASLKKMTEEAFFALDIFTKIAPKLKYVSLVGHSLSGAVALQLFNRYPHIIRKVVLLAPALNQKALMRYWFVRSQNEGKIKITWSNFNTYLNEKSFQKFISRRDIMRKSHNISNAYFLENENKDHQDLLQLMPKQLRAVMMIAGDADEAVPYDSNDNLPRGFKVLKVKGGDHDLWRPDMVKQYLPQLIRFLKGF